MSRIFPKPVLAIALAAAFQLAGAEDSTWVSLLKDGIPNNWTGFFQKLGVGGANETWKMTPEGWLHVDIKVDYNTSGFGHLFYTKRKLSYYMVRAEYKFPANTYGPNWAQGWNRENNGLMLHSQDPATMNGKDFPTSIEVQLLGKNNEQNGGMKSQGFKYATTANMCSPSTFVAYNGNADYKEHCTAATYPAAWKNTEIPWDAAESWSDVTVRVLADSLIQHFIHGIKVMEYTKIRLDNGTPLKEGYLSIQAEGTSTLFRKIEVLDLVGCMDSTKPAYRTYFVKNDPLACNTTGAIPRTQGEAGPALAREGSLLAVQGSGVSIAEVRRADGSQVGIKPGARSFAPDRAGVYLVTIRSAAGISVRKAAWY